MTPEKRLDQLEPFVAEISAQLDRVAAQNRQLAGTMNVVLETLGHHSDSIRFLLTETSHIKADVSDLKMGQAVLTQKVDSLSQEVGSLSQKADSLSQKADSLSQKADSLSQNVDLILQILQNRNGQ